MVYGGGATRPGAQWVGGLDVDDNGAPLRLRLAAGAGKAVNNSAQSGELGGPVRRPNDKMEHEGQELPPLHFGGANRANHLRAAFARLPDGDWMRRPIHE